MAVINTPQLVRQLDKLGFKAGDEEYCGRGLKARFESLWLTFHPKTTNEGEPVSAVAGAPGLWKNVRSPSGRLERIFDLPLATVTQQKVWDKETGDAVCPLDEMIDWVAATGRGELPEGWKCPSREELEESLPSKALTLETGRFARHGQFQCEGNRLAVSFPLLQRVPVDLSPQRRACLDRLLADIEYRSRLVRLVERETSEQVGSILAEADFSGAPRFAVPLLLRIGLDAVRHVVSQNISAVELLVDPAVTSTVWEFPLAQDSPAEGSHP